MRINIAYHRELYLTTITPIINELKNRGYEIIYNSSGASITIGSHLTDLMKWYKRTPTIFIDHGICPGKNIILDFQNLVKIGSFILLSGKYFERILKKVDAKYRKYKIIGYPKLEESLNLQFSREYVIRKYRLDPKKPIILYAPTWYHKTKHNPYSHGTIKYLKKIAKACRDYNLIVFPHSRDFHRKELKYAPVLETEDRVQYYFSASDLLITDFSSVTIEYCYFDKPIIQITDIINKNRKRVTNRPWEEDKFQVGEFVKAKKLKKILPYILSHPQLYKKQRAEWFKDVIEIVEGSTKLAADAVEEYIKAI